MSALRRQSAAARLHDRTVIGPESKRQDGEQGTGPAVWAIVVADAAGVVLPSIADPWAFGGSTLWDEAALALGLLPEDFDPRVDPIDDLSPSMIWRVRVVDRGDPDVGDPVTPGAVTGLLEHLRTALPSPCLQWSVFLDQERTRRAAAQTSLRRRYRRLLDPLEVAMLPRRVDGAELSDPWISTDGHASDGSLLGVYGIELCADPTRTPPGLLVLQAGVLPSDSSESVQRHRRFAGSGEPVLVLPEPEHPITYGVRVLIGNHRKLTRPWWWRPQRKPPMVPDWEMPQRAVAGAGIELTVVAQDPVGLVATLVGLLPMWWPSDATPPQTWG